MRFLSTVLSIALIMLAQNAWAGIFVVDSGDSGVTLSYPDSWHRVSPQLPDEEIVIDAPDNGDSASCRVRVRDDRRFAIYPVRYSRAIQHEAVSKEFWGDYLSEFYYANPISIKDDVGIGRGFASMADVSFYENHPVPVMKRGIMFASLYGNRLYIAECSAQQDAYPAWHPTFMEILKSIDFKKMEFETPTGHYRNFLNDRTLLIHNEKPVDLYVY